MAYLLAQVLNRFHRSPAQGREMERRLPIEEDWERRELDGETAASDR